MNLTAIVKENAYVPGRRVSGERRALIEESLHEAADQRMLGDSDAVDVFMKMANGRNIDTNGVVSEFLGREETAEKIQDDRYLAIDRVLLDRIAIIGEFPEAAGVNFPCALADITINQVRGRLI